VVDDRPGEPDEIVVGNRQEAAGDLDDVEAESAAFGQVVADALGAALEHGLDEAAGGDHGVVFVAGLDQVTHGALGHQRERAARELQDIDVLDRWFASSTSSRAVPRRRVDCSAAGAWNRRPASATSRQANIAPDGSHQPVLTGAARAPASPLHFRA